MNYYNYFTEIEEHFARRRGKHLYVSPMDWSLIATWRDSGVPLHVALRGIDIAMDSFNAKLHRPGKLNTLFYCHDSVMEEYARHLQARLGEGRSAGEDEDGKDTESGIGPDKKTVLEFLAARISEINRLHEKLYGEEGGIRREGLGRIRDRLAEIARGVETDQRMDCETLERDLWILDDALVRELTSAISQDEMASWKNAARKELKIYKKRLPKETYEKIQDNFLRKKIHQRFGIGELSLFHL